VSKTIECKASRRGRTWVVHVPEYGVYGHGRTLKAAHENTTQGLALAGVTAEVTITPLTPELEKLRSAEEAYAVALSDAVAALALRRTTLRDIAVATNVPTTRVKLILAESAKDSASPVDSR
jgi:predicted RNase H-like HicB family nuclease